MSDSLLRFSVHDAVAHIQLDDGRANALGPDMLSALDGALDQALEQARAVVISGRPGRFSAGFDLKVMQGSKEAAKALVRSGGDVLMRIYAHPQPVVAACTGHAIAAGAMLLLVSDYRVGAAGDFKIGLNETTIGLPLPILGRELARARISPHHLFEATALATLYDPGSAVRVGYFDQIEEPEEVVETALEHARRLGEIDARAFGITKRKMRQETIDRVRGGLEAELDDFLPG